MPNALRHPAACAGAHTGRPRTVALGLRHPGLSPAWTARKRKNVSARPRPAQAQGVLLCESTENCSPGLWQPQVTRSHKTRPRALRSYWRKKKPELPVVFARALASLAPMSRVLRLPVRLQELRSLGQRNLPAPFRGGSRVFPHATSPCRKKQFLGASFEM